MTQRSNASGSIIINQTILDNLQNPVIHLLKSISDQIDYGINLITMSNTYNNIEFDATGENAFENTLPDLLNPRLYQNNQTALHVIREFKSKLLTKIPPQTIYKLFIFDFIDEEPCNDILYQQKGIFSYDRKHDQFKYKIISNQNYEHTLNNLIHLYPDNYQSENLYQINNVDDLYDYLDLTEDLKEDFDTLSTESKQYIYEEVRDDPFYRGYLYDDDDCYDFMENLIEVYADSE